MSTETEHANPNTGNTMKDIILWRNKKQSFSAFLVATATWVVLEVYQFNFLTIASWAAMAVVSLFFIWGNLCRLFGKERPSLSEFEIPDQSAQRAAISVKIWVETGVRWLFRVGAESEWYEFAGVIGALWVLSILGGWFDFVTILYASVVGGLSVPWVYVKYEERIKRWRDEIRMGGNRVVEKFNERVVRKVKDKVVGGGTAAIVVEKKEDKEDKKE
ncbi:hypothetical protein Sjap_010109 [Stephania japonica]|uniref:Reticulon-like protein n=1 Tax=Stephania japonica TaxID=461633 RepID=A0AAP0P3C2_9MAGN